MTFRKFLSEVSVVASRDVANFGQPRPIKADFSLLYSVYGGRHAEGDPRARDGAASGPFPGKENVVYKVLAGDLHGVGSPVVGHVQPGFQLHQGPDGDLVRDGHGGKLEAV